MQISRLFQMVYLLQSRGRMTAGELAEHFEVSQRTVLRDVQALSDAGVPVYAMQGKGGGVGLLDGYVLNRATLTADEQREILLALESLATTAHPDAAQTLRKLRAFFGRPREDWIEVDFSRWGSGGAEAARFELLKRAVLERQALRLTYASSYGRTSRRVVYPLKLIYKSQSWYLQAFCLEKQDYRVFKIGRMLEMEPMPQHFTREQYTAPPLESQEQTCPEPLSLVLRCAARSAYRVYDEFGPDCVEPQTDGTLLVRVVLPEGDWVYGFLLTFGPDLQVLEPASVQRELRRRAQMVTKFYEET